MFRLVLFTLISSFTFCFGLEESLLHYWDLFLSKEKNCEVMKLARSLHYDFNLFESLDLSTNDFTADSLEASIFAMLENQLIINCKNLTINEVATREGKIPVFRLCDENQKCIIIIKLFTDPGFFLKELDNQNKIFNMQLSHLRTTAPIAIGKANYMGYTFWLLAETVARGKQLGDIALEGDVKLLPLALKSLARSLAELHLESSQTSLVKENLELPWSFRLSWMDRLVSDTAPFSYLQEDLDKMVDFSRVLQEFVHLNLPDIAYAHGDLNWGNIFYNTFTDEITLIDTTSFDLKCKAALMDFSAAISSLYYFFHNTMTLNDLLELQCNYAISYGELVSNIEPGASDNILKTYWRMCALWVHLSEEIELYDDLFSDEGTTDSNKEQLILVEHRIRSVLEAMNLELSKLGQKKPQIDFSINS